jgi:hypothetical protein
MGRGPGIRVRPPGVVDAALRITLVAGAQSPDSGDDKARKATGQDGPDAWRRSPDRSPRLSDAAVPRQ